MLLHYAQLSEASVEPGFVIRDLFHSCTAPVGIARDHVQESGLDVTRPIRSPSSVDGSDNQVTRHAVLTY